MICAYRTIRHDITGATAVLTAVARFEFTPSIPAFASIDASAANTEENSANISRIKNAGLKASVIFFGIATRSRDQFL